MSRSTLMAVASGKGGVGKTLTSVNLAINFAREGTRVAVVDADPLSNIMAMLDHPVPKRPLPLSLKHPETQAYRVAPGFEVIFPQAKEGADHAADLTEALLRDHRLWLEGRYGVVIVDMPAGVGKKKYLNCVDALVVVTNPEPTAHVAAGAFLKEIGAVWGNRSVYLWHNKYEPRPEEEFDPDDLVGNYNRNVNAQERIVSPPIVPVAFVPPDPALDLTKADPPVLVDLHRAVANALKGLSDASMPPLSAVGKMGSRSAALIAYFLRRSRENDDPEVAVSRLQHFLTTEIGKAGAELPAKLKSDLNRWFTAASDSPLRRQIQKTLEVVNLYIADLESISGTFAAPTRAISRKAVDREMVPLLKILSCLPHHSPMRRLSGLLLFRYTLLKLFSNESALKIITAFIPRRSEGGQVVRDRRRQITGLIGKDSAYQGHYLALVKKLYPVVSRQLDHLVNAFGLRDLLFRNDDGSVARNAYVRLFSETMYEIINSGLGIVAGFRFRPSSRAFKKGYEALMSSLRQDEH